MIWVLLVIYQVKHFVCDYPLQGRFMLGKFLPYPKFILPLLAHSAVHAVATFMIAVCFKPVWVAALLGLLDGAIHFGVDRVKASPDILGRFKALSGTEYMALLEERNRISGIAPDGHVEIDKIDDKFKGNVYFWWALGADQMAHHLTHYMLIALILL